MQRAVTSSSNIFRRALCPGSAREEAKFTEVDSEYSAEGQLLHSLFYRFDEASMLAKGQLEPDQLDALILAETITSDFAKSFMAENAIPETAEHHILHEQTLMFTGSKGPLFPGHSDIIITWHAYKARIVVDAKFGFLEVDEAADNEQLASYAVQAQQRDPVGKCGVAIVQPRNFGPKKSTASYDAASMKAAAKQLEKIVLDTEKPDAPLTAGEKQCHYCRAKVACPAYKAAMSAITLRGETAIQSLDNATLQQIYGAVKFATKIADEVRAEMRGRINAGTLTGYKLVNSGDVRTLNKPLDFLTAIKAATGGKITAVIFDQCREMGWGKLKEAVAKEMGISQDKADKLIKEASAAFVTAVPKEQRIMEEKKK